VRTKRWKYSVTAPNTELRNEAGSDIDEEAYLDDVHDDTFELTHLIGLESHRSVADRMQDRLIRRMVEAGETAPVIKPAPSRSSGQRIVTAAEVES
jgi:hypothetical protein